MNDARVVWCPDLCPLTPESSMFEPEKSKSLRETTTCNPELVVYRDENKRLHSTYVESGRVNEFFVLYSTGRLTK